MNILSFNVTNNIVLERNHIWINPTKDNIKDVAYSTGKAHWRVHVFITDGDVINDNLREFLCTFYYEGGGEPVVTIHVPKSMSDMKVVIDHMMDKAFEEDSWFTRRPRFHVIAESRGAKFKIYEWSRRSGKEVYLNFRFENDRLRTVIDMNTYMFDGYDCHFRKFGGEPGAVKNYMQCRFPELFKDKILASFKESCPEGILKSFKNDDDIWGFILQNGEWANKEGH